jgi:hypothetical protein
MKNTILLIEKEKTSLFEGYVEMFKYLYDLDMMVTSIKDGELVCQAKSAKEDIVLQYGILDIKGTGTGLEDEMVTYRNELRENMEKLQDLVEFTKEQKEKLSLGFAVIKDKK